MRASRLRRTQLGAFAGLLLPSATRTQTGWPVCLTCGRPLDSIELVEGRPGETLYACILGVHHGAEQLHRIDFESVGWNAEHDLRRAIEVADWFRPDGDRNSGLTVT